MNTVLKSESYRLKRSKEIWTMAGILLAIQIIMVGAYFVCRNFSFFDSIKDFFTGSTFFTGIAQTANGSFFHILLIIMIGSLVTKLYQTGVNKQLVSCGISRKNIILGQFVSYTTIFSVVTVVVSVVTGIAHMLCDGKFGLSDVNVGRMGLSLIGMILVVASLCAMYLFITHLTGSLGAAIMLGLAVEMVLPVAVEMVTVISPKLQFIPDYFISNVQMNAVNMESSLGAQLTNMGILVAFTAVLLVLCQIVFSHKEVK